MPQSCLDTTLVIAAGGSGSRFGEENKLLMPLAGRPLLYHSAARLGGMVREVVIAAPEASWEEYRQAMAELTFPLRFARGGKNRSDSIRNALAVIGASDGLVAIQDAARPLTAPVLLLELAGLARRIGGAIPAHRVTDTIKQVEPGGMIRGTIDRSTLAAVQTPQVFQLRKLREAYRIAGEGEFTDDAAVMEYAGFPVAVHFHSYPNPKLTYRGDLPVLELLAREIL